MATSSDSETPNSPKGVLRDAVADRIQARILSGALRPGDRLPPERELAERLGVNRSSVREALKKLEQMGLVTSQQGSGTRVRSLDEASVDVLLRLLFLNGEPNVPWIRDFLDLREVLAPGVIRLALERASEEEIAELGELFGRVADPSLSDPDHLEAVLSASDALARASHNRVVVQVWNSLRRIMTQLPFQNLLFATSGSRSGSAPGVKRLSVAIAARDLATAERAIHDVLGRGRDVILSAIEASREAPPKPRRAPRPIPRA